MDARRSPSADDIARARAKLDQWTWEPNNRVIIETIELGDAAGDLFAEQLKCRKGMEQVEFAAALGDVSGSGGIDELRDAAHCIGPGTQDLRCVALISLAKRLGAESTEDLMIALADRDSSVQYYATAGLAVVGNRDAWDLMFRRIKELLSHPRRTEWEPPEVVVALCYLLANVRSDDEIGQLVELVKSKWQRMTELSKKRLIEILPSLEEGAANVATAFRGANSADLASRIRELTGLFGTFGG